MNFKVGDEIEYVTGAAPQSLGTSWRRATVREVGRNAVRVDDEGTLLWVRPLVSRIRHVDTEAS